MIIVTCKYVSFNFIKYIKLERLKKLKKIAYKKIWNNGRKIKE